MKFRWFVEPDPKTNDAIRRMVPEPTPMEDVRCRLRSGEVARRNLWEMKDWHQLSTLEKGKEDSKFRYTIFRQKGEGQVIEWGPASRSPKFTDGHGRHVQIPRGHQMVHA